MPPILVIANPRANRGRVRHRRAQIQRALAAADARYDWQEPEYPGHAATLAQMAGAAGYATIAVAGGDGTVSEVVNGLMMADDSAVQPALAIFPCGTGNDFAAATGFMHADVQTAGCLVAGQSRAIDIGRVVLHADDAAQTRYFNNSLGVGLEAATVIQADRIQRLNGVVLYAVAAIRTLLHFRAAPMEIECVRHDGHTQAVSGSIMMVSVGNSPRTGGGFHLTPQAKLDDGLLDMGVATAISKLRLLSLLPRALFGKHTSDPAFTLWQCRRIRIQCADGIPVHADGELLSAAAQKIAIEVLPGRLRIHDVRSNNGLAIKKKRG
ncbi:MAG: diacylglycerol kinase family lipid kinase [Caldilineaceae bacterium]|nr:diacylglycerol kinase family lipid kinase [Caldilineaceae bacterium]